LEEYFKKEKTWS